MTNAAAELQPLVTRIVAETLCLETDEVTPEARFFADLDGESIDLLDLQFRIEKDLHRAMDLNDTFGSRIELDQTGEVTPASLEWLRRTYPFLAVDALERPITSERLKDLLTVGTIAEFAALAASRPA